MTADSNFSSLPIDDVLPEIIDRFRTSSSLVLRAPTGAGKTTRVPPALQQSGLAGEGQIVMLEPRRIAARAAAARIAREQNLTLGREVGYQVRFDSKSSVDTRMLVVTEGILLRQLQKDPFLDGVNVVVFDEFHERNLASDLALGMVRRIQQTVRPDLKIAVMSATLDPGPLVNYLCGAAVVESLGRSYPVEIEYLRTRDRRPIAELTAWGIQQVFPRSTGHVLAFLPGVGEIHQTARQLEDFASRQGALLRPLYGDLPPEQQDEILARSEQRKIVLATNVAETSLTIPGVTAVVDSGLARVLRFDSESGLDKLVLEPISQASADQRAGRAGRTEPGICLRLWDETSHRHRPQQTDPEISRVDLAGPVLQLKCWGESDVLAFPWFEAPRREAVRQAEQLLQRLGACDHRGEVTPLGRKLVELPVHPRIACLLLTGTQLGEARRAAWLAALLEERDPFIRSRSRDHRRSPNLLTVSHHSRSDVLDRLAALEEAEQGGGEEFPWGQLNHRAARQIARVRDQLFTMVREMVGRETVENTGVPSDGRTFEVLSRALIAAFPDRVARRRSPGSAQGVLVGGRGVKLSPSSAVRAGDLFLCVDVDSGQSEALVRQASLVETDWLPESAITSRTEVFFHPSQKQVVARNRVYFDDLLLSESPCSLPEDDAASDLLFAEASRVWRDFVPGKGTAVGDFLLRLKCLAQWMPELELPTFEEPELLDILKELCRGCRSFTELKNADWFSLLQIRLDWTQLQTLEREAPESIVVPTGSRIRLKYADDSPPVLAVRIQELFGLAQTPRIAGGRVPVLLHLLGPNYQPQQVTDDLASFWSNTYPVVRKELARRYPRHPWPEDPLTARPVRK